MVNGLGWCNRLSIHTFGRFAGRQIIYSFSIAKNMGAIDWRLLCLPFRANILVVWICSNAWGPRICAMYHRFTGNHTNNNTSQIRGFKFCVAGTRSNTLPISNIMNLQVNAYLGAFIEGMATLVCRLASRTIADLGMRHATFIDSFIGTSFVVAGNDLFHIFFFIFTFSFLSLRFKLICVG